MVTGFDRLDEVIEQGLAHSKMSDAWMIPLRFCAGGDGTGIASESIDRVKYYLGANQFYGQIKASMKAWQWARMDSKVFAKPAHYRFKHYMNVALPMSLNAFHGTDGEVYSWLDRASRNGHVVRLLIAEDDWVNNETFAQLLDYQSVSHLLLLRDAGHLGYLTLPWFDQFLRADFDVNSSNQ